LEGGGGGGGVNDGNAGAPLGARTISMGGSNHVYSRLGRDGRGKTTLRRRKGQRRTQGCRVPEAPKLKESGQEGESTGPTDVRKVSSKTPTSIIQEATDTPTTESISGWFNAFYPVGKQTLTARRKHVIRLTTTIRTCSTGLGEDNCYVNPPWRQPGGTKSSNRYEE